MIKKAEEILQKRFGYRTFRPLQAEIIQSVLNKKDTLVIMPTGGGKSICYQIPALLFPGITIVVSPLISLMKDQVEQLQEVGVEAVFVNSTLSPEAYGQNIRKIRNGTAKLLYLAPETLLKARTLQWLADLPVDCLTIDEAHCISEWGHDFRPEYREIVKIRENFPQAVCLALTATATPRVQKDMKNTLNFTSSQDFVGSFNRPNLFLHVEAKQDPLKQTIRMIEKYPDQSGIIYCFSRKQVDKLYQVLDSKGYSVKPYHAGLAEAERLLNQELFSKDQIQIMVATIAFGMGINKPNVRFVIHYDLPKNLETYYQEIGRAGRDGLASDCLLLFSYSDIQKVKFFIDQKEEKEQRIANIHLNDLLRFVETDVCRRVPLINYFGENYQGQCQTCDNCYSSGKDQTDITQMAGLFLKCVNRTGQVFGTNYIIDVLRGAKTSRIQQFNHENLEEVYGQGTMLSKKQWFHLSRQLIQKGFLVQELLHGSLKITDKAYDTFRRKEKVLGIIEEEKPAFSKKEKAPREIDGEYDRRLFSKLRQKRKELAVSMNLPPYVIFSDRSLIEMATFFPLSLENLLDIHGVGEFKQKKYGPQFLSIITDHLSQKG